MDTRRYAMIDENNIVQNVVRWDGLLETWTPPDDITMIEIPDDMWGGVGDRWDPDLQQIVAGETLP